MSRKPLASFPLPPCIPAAVADVAPRFDAIASEWASNLGEIVDAEEAQTYLRAANIRQAAARIAAGDAPVDTTEAETDADETIGRLERRDAELSAALDIVGNQLADAIGQEAAPWAEELEKEADAARAALAAAVTEAQAALERFGRATTASDWLRSFKTDEAKKGLVRPWHGKSPSFTVDGNGLGRDIAGGLKLIGQFAEPPVEPASIITDSPEPSREPVTARSFA
jgi:hypothetical protein